MESENTNDTRSQSKSENIKDRDTESKISNDYVEKEMNGETNNDKKKKSLFNKLKFWKKTKSDKKSTPTTEQKKKMTYICDSFSDIPEEWQKKITEAEISTNFDERNFKILLNILRFITKDSFRMTNQVKEDVKRRPYASDETLAIINDKIHEEQEKVLKKRYRNLEFAGEGGFGRVFYAKDSKRGCKVAIKKLPHTSEKSCLNNKCEVAFLASCNHPNIVKFLDAWHVIDKNEMWIVTEYLEGGTLSEAVKDHKFNERHIAYIAREILRALKYLHSLGFVHRDLKSANVMMSMDGDIKLIDFGLCCDMKDGPRKQILGSPFWIPPEMIKGKNHSYPADIWSFAVCIIEMYMTKPPNSHSKLYSLYTSSTKGLKSYIPSHASDMAKDFLKRCLTINQKKRATAEELLRHPFVTQPNLSVGIEDVLRTIFVKNSLALSGILKNVL